VTPPHWAREDTLSFPIAKIALVGIEAENLYLTQDLVTRN
jgi:hypothetical protein